MSRKDPCERCVNNHDGTVNTKHCVECICVIADSTAFKQMVKENNRLLEERRVIDKQWQQEVIQKMDELRCLLEGK